MNQLLTELAGQVDECYSASLDASIVPAGTMTRAAVCHMQHAHLHGWMLSQGAPGAANYCAEKRPSDWPTHLLTSAWQPRTPRQDLLRSAALLLLEVDRMDRKGRYS